MIMCISVQTDAKTLSSRAPGVDVVYTLLRYDVPNKMNLTISIEPHRISDFLHWISVGDEDHIYDHEIKEI